ncbi:MAG TPA: aminotransferase class III-fold pyridoxal phosphate-dependent enzyme [Armatimonadota bacterium]|nr:aminotransferase class III-fold pyridoxal phosphate-dependent enzyme [Armatimonadota bacterium]
MAFDPNRPFDAVFADYKTHVNPSMADLLRFMGFESVEHHALGARVYDAEGVEYIDCLGGFGVMSLGHCSPPVIAAVRDQLERMAMGTRVLFPGAQAALARRIAEVTPGDLQYSFFVNSGAEAVEGALKLARFATRRTAIVAALEGFHGKTLGALSASGRAVYKAPFEPLVPGFVHVPFGDVDALDAAVDSSTAAVILEPIQGEGGVIVPPDGYLAAARAACDRAGALLILDEVQTGFGRTGRMFACEHEGVCPDVMTLGKALGGGVMPIGAFTARPHLWTMFAENPLLHSSTFGGNPLACVAGIAAIDTTVEQGLPERAATLGAHAKASLQRVADAHPDVIAAVRGRGLMLGVSFTDPDIGGLVIAGLAQRRVLAAYTLNNPSVVRFQPPLVIEEELLDEVIRRLEDSVVQTKEMLAGLEE